MKQSILLALLAALPLVAQEESQGTPGARPGCHCVCPCGVRPHHRGPGPEMRAKMRVNFDANKDGQLDEQEKAAMRAEWAKRHQERRAEMLEKFDANKDGQLDEQEKAAMREHFGNGPRRGPRCHRAPKGPRCGVDAPKPPCAVPAAEATPAAELAPQP